MTRRPKEIDNASGSDSDDSSGSGSGSGSGNHTTAYTAVQVSPSVIRATYATAEQLKADYWCIWVGVQGNIVDPDVKAMMQSCGVIDEWVQQGGILVVHGAHTSSTIAVAPCPSLASISQVGLTSPSTWSVQRSPQVGGEFQQG